MVLVPIPTSSHSLFCRSDELSVWAMIPSGSLLLKDVPCAFKPNLFSEVMPQVASQEPHVEILSIVTSGLKFRRGGRRKMENT